MKITRSGPNLVQTEIINISNIAVWLVARFTFASHLHSNVDARQFEIKLHKNRNYMTLMPDFDVMQISKGNCGEGSYPERT